MKQRSVRGRVSVTEVGLGTAQLGNLYQEMTDDEAVATIEASWNYGIRHFDTAPHYGLGLSERRLGAALKRYARDEYTISSKVGRLLVPANHGGTMDDEGFAVPATHRRVWDFSRTGILRSIEDTLKRTGLDRLDIVYLHDPDHHWEEASTTGIGTLLELRDEGVLGAVGVGMNQTEMPARFIREADIDVVMLAGRYTLLDQSGLDDLLPLALDHGVAVVAAGVYNSGLLSSPNPQAGAMYDYQTAAPELVARAVHIAEICKAHGTLLPEAALAYALEHPAVVSVVLGARSAAQARENCRRYEARPEPALWQDLYQNDLLRSTNLQGKS